VVQGPRPRGRIGLEAPQVGCQAAGLRNELRVAAGVVDRGEDLRPIAHDARIGHEALDVTVIEVGDGRRVEPGERTPEVRALAEDREPAQSGLEALEAQLLEEPVVVLDWAAPLLVVVGDVQRVVARPPAARPSVEAFDDALGHRGRLLHRFHLPGSYDVILTAPVRIAREIGR
jgi:hypothetical protein